MEIGPIGKAKRCNTSVGEKKQITSQHSRKFHNIKDLNTVENITILNTVSIPSQCNQNYPSIKFQSNLCLGWQINPDEGSNAVEMFVFVISQAIHS